MNRHVVPELTSRTPPGPTGYPLLGVLPTLPSNPLQRLTQLSRQHGGVVRLGGRTWGPQWFLLNDPEYIKYVLQEHSRNYRHGIKSAVLGRHLVGNGLPMNDGSSWLQQRRLIQPAFHQQRIAGFVTTITDTVAAMNERWYAVAPHKALDMQHEMQELMLHIVVQTVFGSDISHDQVRAIADAVVVAAGYVNWLALVPLPLWIPTRKNRAFRRALQVLNALIHGFITERRQRPSERSDLLSLLLAAQDEETGIGMNDKQLRDEVMSIFLAGHETTANALAWTWYLLALHPDVEQRLHAEVDSVLSGRVPTIEDLPKLRYTRMVLEEALRLYPPAWLFTRSPIMDDEIGGYRIRKNAVLLISPYVTHRHPAFWKDPDVFDPERFTPERVKERPRFVYLPFGGGPHQCIGNTLAMMEAQLIIAMIAQTYRFQLVPQHPVEPQALVILRARYGIHMTLSYRGVVYEHCHANIPD